MAAGAAATSCVAYKWRVQLLSRFSPTTCEEVDHDARSPRSANDRFDVAPQDASRRRRRGGHRGDRSAVGAWTDRGERAGRAADDDHPAAARLQSKRGADHLLQRSGCPYDRAGVRRSAPAQRTDSTSVDGRPVVGRTGLERRRSLSPMERYSEQSTDALDRGRRPCQRVQDAVKQQQRQHVRFPGTPAFLRTRHAARRALRARWVGDDHRFALRGQAAEFAQRRRAASRRQLLVHRSALRRTALRRNGRCIRWTRQQGGPPQPEDRPAAGSRQLQARVAHERLPRGQEGQDRSRGARG